jgi:hypothetical protein
MPSLNSVAPVLFHTFTPMSVVYSLFHANMRTIHLISGLRAREIQARGILFDTRLQERIAFDNPDWHGMLAPFNQHIC